MVYVIVLFCLIGISKTSFASAVIDKPVLDLGEIIISASKSESKLRDSSKSISVITTEDIKMSTSNSAADILNILPGVFVHKTGQFGRNDIVIRGHGSRGRRVMVLIDGRPEKMGLFGCTITHTLQIENVDRIEVIRGPESVLYGSDAIGGVVNIITKKAKTKTEGDVSVSYGSFDTQEYRLRQGGDINNFNYYFNFDRIQSRGHLPNSDYNHKNYSLSLGYKVSDALSLSFNSGYFDGFKREPQPSAENTWNDYKRGSFDLTLDGGWAGFTQQIKIYRNFGHHRFSDGYHSKDYTDGVMFHINISPYQGNNLISGIEYRRLSGKLFSGGIPGEYSKEEKALFFQDEQRLFDEKIILNAGVRYNNDSISGDFFSPSAGLVWHALDNVLFRLSCARGFRAPQLNELRFYNTSNPDLKAEKVWNYEAGINYKLNNSLILDCAYFIMKADSFIRVANGKFQNIDELEFNGFEVSLGYNFLDNMAARLSFTRLDSGKYTQGRPENELGLSLLYSRDKYKFSLNAQCVDNYFASDEKKEAIPNFLIVNTKYIYDISDSLECFLSVENIFNVEHKLYVDIAGAAAGVYTQSGRTFSLGVVYKW